MLLCGMGPAAAGKSGLAEAVAAPAPDVAPDLARDVAARVPVRLALRAAQQSVDGFWSQPLCYDWPLLDAALAAEDPERRSTPSYNARTLLAHVAGRTGQDGKALAATTSAYQRAESLGVRTSVS